MSDSQTPVELVGPSSPKPSPDIASKPPTRRSMAGVLFLSAVLYLLLLDAAVETFLAGALVRWIVGGTVAAYLAPSVVLQRRLGLAASASWSVLDRARSSEREPWTLNTPMPPRARPVS